MVTVSVSGDACHVQASANFVRRLIVIATSEPPGADVRAGVATMSESAHGPVGSGSTGAGGVVSTGTSALFFFLPFLPLPVRTFSPTVGPAEGTVLASTFAPLWVAVPLAASLPSDDPPRTQASTTTRRIGTASTMMRRVQ